MSKQPMSQAWKRILPEALILCALAFAVGLSLNYSMVMNAFSGKTVAVKQLEAKKAAPDQLAEQAFPELVELDEIDELVAGGAQIVDARNINDFKAGHLKNAISLPLGEVEALLENFIREVPKSQPLILYCNGFGCPDSFDLGVRLIAAGYQQVLVYEGGFPEWRDQGRPLEEGLQ